MSNSPLAGREIGSAARRDGIPHDGDVMKLLLAGALAMGFGIAGLFFLRFWRKTRDRLFALFALSFLVMALNRVMLALLGAAGAQGADRDPWADRLYWVRLIAFTLILVAILDKNRARAPLKSGPQ